MSSEDQGGAGRREVAYRLFAAEFEDADYSYSESDEERAPNYVVTPTGARVNRMFVVGVLTEVEEAGEDILRARVVDQTGAFVVYAGQYQPEAQAFFERAEPPAFVAVTGKARTFQPDDSEITYTSVRPENVNEVTAETRDRWSVQAARQTLDRVATMARALDRDERGDQLRELLESRGVDTGLAAGIPLAIDHYGTTGAYLEAVRDLAVQVAEVVAGERDEVDALARSPDASGPADLTDLATLDLPTSAGGAGDAAAVAATVTSESTGTASGSGADGTTDTAAETAGETTGDESTATAASGGASGVDEPAAGGVDAEESGGEAESGSQSDETAGSAEPGETEEPGTAAQSGGTGGDIGDFEPGEFDLDEEEREAIEEEYGTGFQSGTEVDDPGQADIDTPEPDADAATGDAGADSASEPVEPDSAEGAVDEPEGETESEAAATGGDEASTAEGGDETGQEVEAAEAGDADPEDVDLDEAVMDAMEDRDEGDGAPEDDIVEAVTARLGVGEDEVRDALDEALMGGKCYEPEDGVYKPI